MRVNKRRREAESAIDLLLSAVITINCDRCRQIDSVTTNASDADDAASYFYEEGWRVKGERLLCKRCRRREG